MTVLTDSEIERLRDDVGQSFVKCIGSITNPVATIEGLISRLDAAEACLQDKNLRTYMAWLKACGKET